MKTCGGIYKPEFTRKISYIYGSLTDGIIAGLRIRSHR